MVEAIRLRKPFDAARSGLKRRWLRQDRRGVTAIEYAIIVGILAAAIVGGVPAIGRNLTVIFTNVGAGL